jgi:hypothetical protein
MSLTTRDDSLVAGRGIEPVKVFDSGGRRNTVVVKSLDFVRRTQVQKGLSPEREGGYRKGVPLLSRVDREACPTATVEAHGSLVLVHRQPFPVQPPATPMLAKEGVEGKT